MLNLSCTWTRLQTGRATQFVGRAVLVISYNGGAHWIQPSDFARALCVMLPPLLPRQAQAKLLVERNTVQSLSAHYEDLKAAQAHLTNSYTQQQSTITRLREELDKVSCPGNRHTGCRQQNQA